MAALFAFIFFGLLWGNEASRSNHTAGNGCVFEYINATVIVTNMIQRETFNLSATLTDVPKTTALELLEAAADQDDRFRFTVKYFGGNLGYYIETVHGLTRDIKNKTYWEITDREGNPHDQGVFNHRPEHDEVLRLVFTKYTDTDVVG